MVKKGVGCGVKVRQKLAMHVKKTVSNRIKGSDYLGERRAMHTQ